MQQSSIQKKTILSAKNVQKTFSNNGVQVHVLSNVNADIYSGDFTVIMGASGSGKSTLLYALSGMDKATAGEVLYYRDNSEPIDITSLKEAGLAELRVKDFGFVFQQMHLVSNLTLFENVAVTGYLDKRKSAAETKAKADELLDRVGLKGVKNHLPARVSGGEQQRCAIARAVINTPTLLFADEPTGALNRNNTKEVLNLLTELNDRGQSIVMVTHDIKAALRANRLLYLEDGNIVGELELTGYNETDASGEKIQSDKAREAQVNAWLESLDW
ncbi:MAG: ABC transporter ATP-binding protein [Lachnospiraceae bacterium]|nr:ABC transporter ATP-binding protein [Lachnospiraceae bacterium]